MAVEFPAEIQRFLLEKISSVEQLEALLLLRNSPEKEWTAEDISRQLYSNPSAVEMRLKDLIAHRLVRATTSNPVTYHYAPANREQEALIELLADIYKERRVAVISLIYSKPSTQVQALADAFRFRKDK